MYAKIFTQIFDSTLAEDYQTRHIFMDLLVLADPKGIVDMTLPAISRRTNVPIKIIESAIRRLCQPDKNSRIHTSQGRRLILVDPARDWGWQIVNFESYHRLRDENARREQNRINQQAHRHRQKEKATLVSNRQQPSAASAHADVDVDTDKDTDVPERQGAPRTAPLLPNDIKRKTLPMKQGKSKADRDQRADKSGSEAKPTSKVLQQKFVMGAIDILTNSQHSPRTAEQLEKDHRSLTRLAAIVCQENKDQATREDQLEKLLDLLWDKYCAAADGHLTRPYGAFTTAARRRYPAWAKRRSKP